jgi:hypothetical protein
MPLGAVPLKETPPGGPFCIPVELPPGGAIWPAAVLFPAACEVPAVEVHPMTAAMASTIRKAASVNSVRTIVDHDYRFQGVLFQGYYNIGWMPAMKYRTPTGIN